MKSSLLFTGESRQPPADDEFEISLFGPGIGECIVVHLGWGEWVVVDSCCPVGSDEPIALSYLSALGVPLDSAVRLVVATHWHRDHIQGMARLLDACAGADFVCSVALESKAFVKLVTALGQRPMMESSGVEEFHRIIGLLKTRAVSGRALTPKWAMVDRSLHENRARGIEIRSLAPSDAAVTLALREFETALPQAGNPKRRAVARTPNENSVVMWVRSGAVSALLGGDLETSSNAAVGWTAIVNSASRPSEQARLFKVPHHGSANADEPRVWSEMLTAPPVAALTAYASGIKPLPSSADVRRLAARTKELYCTGPPEGWKPAAKSAAVEKTLREVARNRRAITGPMGHVRLRTSLQSNGDPVRVLLANGAANLAA